MVAGRALALVAYRDAERWGDRPLDRGDDDARGTVLALMPPACDGQGVESRQRAARAFWDLAEDLAAGRAPLARCAAESWALQVMPEHAPRFCAATEAELRTWGVAADGDADYYYPPDFDEQPFMLMIDGAETTIPEARDTEDQDAENDGAEPEGGWSARSTGSRRTASPFPATCSAAIPAPVPCQMPGPGRSGTIPRCTSRPVSGARADRRRGSSPPAPSPAATRPTARRTRREDRAGSCPRPSRPRLRRRRQGVRRRGHRNGTGRASRCRPHGRQPRRAGPPPEESRPQPMPRTGTGRRR